MVLPDTPERDPSRSHRLPALGAVATMSVIAVLILGRLTSPSPPPDPSESAVTAPESTTTTVLRSTPEIEAFAERGQPLTWEALAGIGGHRPLAIVELNGEVLVFTTPADSLVGELGQISINEPWRYGGLDAWWPWQPQSELLPSSARVVASGTLFHTIESTSFGLLAMGVEAGTGLPSTWTSTDGRDWSRLDLHDPLGDSIYIYEAHVHGESTFLFAIDNPRAGWPYAREVAHDRYGDAAFTMVHLTRDRYAIFGVLGLHLGVISVPDGDPVGATPNYYLMRTEDAIEWEFESLPEIDAVFVGDLVTSPDGDLWMLAYTFEGPVVYTSPNGSEWVRHHDQTLTHAGGVYARVLNSRPSAEDNLVVTMDDSGTTLLHSENLHDWTEVFDFGTILSPSYGNRTWNLGAWDSGTQGIALVTQRVESVPEVHTEEPIETLHKDGFTLEVSRHHVRLMGPGADITVSRYYSVPHDRIRFDLDTGSVVFLDVDGGEVVRFSFHDLAAVDVPSLPDPAVVTIDQAFLHSRDGLDWTVQDISDVTGGTWATHLSLVGDRVYLVTGSGFDDRFYSGGDQGWILSATIP